MTEEKHKAATHSINLCKENNFNIIHSTREKKKKFPYTKKKCARTICYSHFYAEKGH